MRDVIITRKKRFLSPIFKAPIVIDGYIVGKVKNGETVKHSIDDDAHEIFTYNDQKKGEVFQIGPGTENLKFQIKIRNNWFVLVPESPDSIHKKVEKVDPTPKNQTASYICGTIISLILLFLGLIMFSTNRISAVGLILCSIFALACGITFIAGGFWFVIIPLPYIYVYKIGCLKPHLSRKKRIGLGLLSFGCFMLSFFSIAIFEIR